MQQSKTQYKWTRRTERGSRSLRPVWFVLSIGSGVLLNGCGTPTPTPSPTESQVTQPREDATSDSRQARAVAPPADEAPSVSPKRGDHRARAINALSQLAQNEPSNENTTAPERVESVYRPDFVEPEYDPALLERLGIRRYESARLVLYTDIDDDKARTLPGVIDAAYEAWRAYFGPLAPSRDGQEYRLVGYVMRDLDRFEAAGMVPDDLPPFAHGRHLGQQFWMREQETDYYRRHLLIHEGTHCYTMAMPGLRPPLWYLEGIAEYFGTHHIDDAGDYRFGVMPGASQDVLGFGRVQLIEQEREMGRVLSLEEVSALGPSDYLVTDTPAYAWSWALCVFLDHHPRYRERFRALAEHLVGREFYRLLDEEFREDLPALNVEWELFARNLCYGYDFEAAAVDFRVGVPLSEGKTWEVKVAAARGWQSSGLWLERGERYQIECDGEVILAETTRPWNSTPEGITIEYARGRPLGRVLAAVQSNEPPGPSEEGTLWKDWDVGGGIVLVPDTSGTLYLRVNDRWNSLATNRGSYLVRVSRVATDQ